MVSNRLTFVRAIVEVSGSPRSLNVAVMFFAAFSANAVIVSSSIIASSPRKVIMLDMAV